MKVNLKDNIFIEGFDNQLDVYNSSIDLCLNLGNFSILYEGKSSEIPEDLVKKCVTKTRLRNFKNYKTFRFCGLPFTAKESIQSACDKEYCIIYKIK